jgi:hypothetical protein
MQKNICEICAEYISNRSALIFVMLDSKESALLQEAACG